MKKKDYRPLIHAIFEEIKAKMRKDKQKTFKFPYANKKYTILSSGKIKTEVLS